MRASGASTFGPEHMNAEPIGSSAAEPFESAATANACFGDARSAGPIHHAASPLNTTSRCADVLAPTGMDIAPRGQGISIPAQAEVATR